MLYLLSLLGHTSSGIDDNPDSGKPPHFHNNGHSTVAAGTADCDK